MSTITTSVLAAAALATGLGFAALPTGGEPAAAINHEARYAGQLEQAFELAAAITVDRKSLEAVVAAARKSDRLAAPALCGRQSWPYVAPDCLAGSSGQAVRTVTVEYRVGENTSVLVRHPAAQIASR